MLKEHHTAYKPILFSDFTVAYIYFSWSLLNYCNDFRVKNLIIHPVFNLALTILDFLTKCNKNWIISKLTNFIIKRHCEHNNTIQYGQPFHAY